MRRRILPVLLLVAALTVWALPAGAEEAPDEPAPGLPGAICQIAQAIADVFGSLVDDMTALHEEGIGFGAMFKLSLLAHAQGISVAELLAQLGYVPGEDGEFDFGFGELFRALTEEQRALLEEFPRNLGQVISGLHRRNQGGHGHRGHGPGGAPPGGGDPGEPIPLTGG